jgi:hypothetical protein
MMRSHQKPLHKDKYPHNTSSLKEPRGKPRGECLDGVFEVEDTQSHFVSARGSRIEMGPSVMVETAGIILLLTSRPTALMDPASGDALASPLRSFASLESKQPWRTAAPMIPLRAEVPRCQLRALEQID